MATYAFGDVQGCFDTFERLLKKIDFRSGRDRLWFAGDLVNRGPGSLAMLRWLTEHDRDVQVVLGNHDLHLLGVASGVRQMRKDDTLEELLQAPDCESLLAWLRQQPIVFRDPPYFMVHAGLLPQWTIDQAVRLAAELQSVLCSTNASRFLAALGGPVSEVWLESLEGVERWVTLQAIFTTLRNCTLSGKIVRGYPGPPENAPAGAGAWFDMPHRKSTEAVIVFGHWASLGLLQRPNLWGLDTGCVWGGVLTAVRLEDRRIFHEPQSPVDAAGSVPLPEKYRKLKSD